MYIGILGFFAAAVLISLFTGAPARLIGGLLLAVGLGAIAGARGVAAAAAQPHVVRVVSLGTRTKSTIRPTTIVLWGISVALIGLLQLLGF